MRPPIPIEDALAVVRDDRRNSEAWSRIYSYFWPYVVRLAYQYTNCNKELTEEVAHETLVRLFRYGRFDRQWKLEELRRYLTTICQRVAAGLMSGRYGKQREGMASYDEAKEHESNEHVPSPEELLRVEELYTSILNQLTHTDRQIVTMLVEGYSLKEIAAALSVKYNTVTTRVSRLRSNLRNLLEPDDKR